MYSMSGGEPSGATPRTMAAAPSPKIIRDGRTLPILSENFSAQTTSTGRLTSCRSRTASARPYGNPAQAAMTSKEPCVWKIPSCPESHVATDGISLVLVHEQKTTDPISSARRPAPSSAARAACSEMCSRRRSRSEEHTSELQSRSDLVCRLLLEKKKRHFTRLLTAAAED